MQSAKERIAFLEQQLEGAVMHLRVSQDNHSQMLATMSTHEDRLKAIYKEKRDRDEARNKQIQVAVTHLQRDASRYAFIRQHMVQVWKLSIAAEGHALDCQIDTALQRHEKSAA